MIGVSQTVCAFEIQLPVGYLMLKVRLHIPLLMLRRQMRRRQGQSHQQ